MSKPAYAQPELHNGSHPSYTFPLWNEITVLKVLCAGVCAFTQILMQTRKIGERLIWEISLFWRKKQISLLWAVTLTVACRAFLNMNSEEVKYRAVPEQENKGRVPSPLQLRPVREGAEAGVQEWCGGNCSKNSLEETTDTAYFVIHSALCAWDFLYFLMLTFWTFRWNIPFWIS